MNHPKKWRETIDPHTLPYRRFTLIQVTGYPHAGNDVFQATGLVDGQEREVFIKAARQQGADLQNEVETIQKLRCPLAPEIVDYDQEDWDFVVTLAKPGERLSTLVGDNRDLASMSYLYEYGRALAKLHQVTGDFPPVKDRRFFHLPQRKFLEDAGLGYVWRYLAGNPPPAGRRGFCHGDFHYANLLWAGGRLSAILDFELSGIGNQAFDLAWALILRPGQTFLNTRLEIDCFLAGYSSLASFCWEAVQYYMVLIYSYFYQFSSNPPQYTAYIRQLFQRWCGNSTGKGETAWS